MKIFNALVGERKVICKEYRFVYIYNRCMYAHMSMYIYDVYIWTSIAWDTDPIPDDTPIQYIEERKMSHDMMFYDRGLGRWVAFSISDSVRNRKIHRIWRAPQIRCLRGSRKTSKQVLSRIALHCHLGSIWTVIFDGYEMQPSIFICFFDRNNRFFHLPPKTRRDHGFGLVSKRAAQIRCLFSIALASDPTPNYAPIWSETKDLFPYI